MTQKTDYAGINIPEGKDPQNYTVDQRRAEEYHMVKAEGTFRILHTINLGKHYGVNPSQITRDRKALQEYLLDSFTNSNILPDIILSKRWALKQAQDSGDYKEANHIGDSLLKMSFDMGVIEKQPDKLEIDGGLTLEGFVDGFRRYKEGTK